MRAGFLRGGAARSGASGDDRSTRMIPGSRDVRVGGGGVRSSERFFFVGPGRFFLSSRGGTTDARRGDATPGRGGARAHRRLVRRRVRDVRDVVRLRVRDARFARVLLRGRPPRAARRAIGRVRGRRVLRRGARRRDDRGGSSEGVPLLSGARGRGGLRPVHAPARGRGRRGDVHRVHRGERRGARGGVREGGAEGEGDEARGRGENNNERRRNRSAFPRGDKPKIRNGRAVSAALFQDCSNVWNLVSRSRGELGRDDALT